LEFPFLVAVADADDVGSADLDQQFINLPSSIFFEIIVQCAWETVAVTFQFSLLNGGPASMVYGAILGTFGATAVALSLAEMVSMYTLSNVRRLECRR
jgi:hypothetical protein